MNLASLLYTFPGGATFYCLTEMLLDIPRGATSRSTPAAPTHIPARLPELL